MKTATAPGDQRHPTEARLRGAGNFRRVFSGRRLHGKSFSITWHPNGLAQARLGLIVSKRTARRAVVRNRLKRLIRESFRRHRLALAAHDVVVTARREAVDQPGAVLLAELEALWRRLPS